MEKLNQKAVEDDELEAAAGGFLLDVILDGISAKAADGAVCPACGGATGMLESIFGYSGHYFSCKKCGNVIMVPLNDTDQTAKL